METHNPGQTSVTERLRLAALDGVHLMDTPPEERFDRITRLARQIFDVPIAQINLIGEFEQYTKTTVPEGIPARRSTNDTFCSVTIQTPGLLVVPDATKDARFDERESVTGPHHIRFYAGRPLSLGDDLRIGTLCLGDIKPRDLTAEELAVLDEMGTWVERELRDSRDPDGEAGTDASGASIPNLRTTTPSPATPAPTEGIARPAAPTHAPLLSPSALNIATPTFSVAAASVPMRKIGSDFFAWREIDGVVEMTVADVMGKGAVAAAIASTVRDTLQKSAGADVGETLANANADLARDLKLAGIFATLFHARMDVATGIVEYADAGHGLTLIVRSGGAVERLESSGFPLGLLPRGTWTVRTTILQEGDVLVSFTDGVLGLFDGTISSLPKVVELVRASSDTRDIVDRVVALNAHQRGGDDVTIIAMSRTE